MSQESLHVGNFEEIANKFEIEAYSLKIEKPIGVPMKLKSTYDWIFKNKIETVINIIENIGGVCTYRNYYDLRARELYGFNWKNHLSESFEAKCRREVGILKKMNFIKVESFGRTKIFTLLRASKAITTGDYNDKKNIKSLTRVSHFYIMKAFYKYEYYLNSQKFLSGKNGIIAIKTILSMILNEIRKNNNSYGYDVSFIEELIKENDTEAMIRATNRTSEGRNKLGIVRTLTTDVLKIFNGVHRSGHFLSQKPHYLKIFSLNSGEVRLHYVPNFVLISGVRDFDYYENFINRNLILFSTIRRHEKGIVKSNELLDKFKKINLNEAKNLGYDNKLSFFGYAIHILGHNKEYAEKLEKHIRSHLVELRSLTGTNKKNSLEYLKNLKCKETDIEKKYGVNLGTYITNSTERHASKTNEKIERELEKMREGIEDQGNEWEYEY